MSDSRAQRIGRNEALFREVNEQVEALADRLDMGGEELQIVCECGDETCNERITISPQEYEALRSDSRTFAVVSDHVAPDVERVVERRSRYWIVEKHPGEPTEVAEALDPRAP